MGFVGSNVVHQAVRGGHQVLTTVHHARPAPGVPFETAAVDLCDHENVLRSVAEWVPDVIVHCAILNDPSRLRTEPELAQASYVGATRSLAEAAVQFGASLILVSTDWVFDGTQSEADEQTGTRPINRYGQLKAESEVAALALGGSVARMSGVNGLHRARPDAPRTQDAGFGYFVCSLVDTLRRGDPFVVWEADDINMVATPSLASESAAMILAIAAQPETGIFHCCGGESIGRIELAYLACEVFDLDPTLVRTGPPDRTLIGGEPVPYDTSLSMPRTREVLVYEPPTVTELLRRFRAEYEEIE